jgi:hypothetical protein
MKHCKTSNVREEMLVALIHKRKNTHEKALGGNSSASIHVHRVDFIGWGCRSTFLLHL